MKTKQMWLTLMLVLALVVLVTVFANAITLQTVSTDAVNLETSTQLMQDPITVEPGQPVAVEWGDRAPPDDHSKKQ